MSDTTDLTRYRSEAHLELCLELVEEAYNDLEKGHYDLAKIQLHEILETFEKHASDADIMPCKKNIVPFPSPR
jgi:hypothetical protein